MKKFSLFLSIVLTLAVVFGNSSLPVFAYEKESVNLEQTKTLSDISGATLNKLNSTSKSTDTLSQNLSEPKKKLSTDLLKLIDSSFLLPTQTRTQLISEMKGSKQFVAKTDSVQNINKRVVNKTHNDLVYVYVSLQPTTPTSVIDSIAWNVTDRDENNHLAVALVDVNKLETLASLNGVKSISSVIPPITNSGSVVTEGDVIHQTAAVRATYSQGGAGMKIGVISDGVDHISIAKSTGDLPAGVTVLSNSEGGDEGTAMLEIIYDMAPSANLYFHDAGSSEIAFNSAIDDLVTAGVNVIVDDVVWKTEPSFEDGAIIASHIASVLASHNIVYVSSAGNYAQQHYQGNYYNDGYNFNDFSSGSQPAYKYLYVDIPPGKSVDVVLQWNDSFGSSNNNYNLYLYKYPDYGTPLASSVVIQNGNDNPFERVTYTNTTGSTIEAEIDINNYQGLAEVRALEVFIFGDGLIHYSDNRTIADSIFGHAAVSGVIAVGSIDANDPGNDTIEPSSSQGPVTIIGQTPRAKPDITGIDCVKITGAGGFTSGAPSSPPVFCGTSAAAPAVAATVAQLWGQYPSATSTQIKNHILNSAVDLGAAGTDTIFGHGRADSLSSFQTGPTITSFNFATPAVTGVINEINKTIALTVPFGTNITALAPTIIKTGASVSPLSGVAKNFTTPQIYTVTASDGLIKFYTATVTFDTNPDIAKVAADKAALVDSLIQGINTNLSNITTSLTNPLPALGTINSSTITWASNTPAVVSNNGQTVVRPAFGNSNATVILTATITKGVVVDTKTFTLTVLAETINPDITFVTSDKASLVDNSIKGGNPDLSNITIALTNPLPVLGASGSTISWISSSPTVVSNNGQTIVRPAFAGGNTTVTMTATITKGVITDTKVFTLTVLKLPASTVATITSATYTVGANTITNVPLGTSKANFLAALSKGELNQTWNDAGINNPVATGNTLIVTAQDGSNSVAYTVTVNAATLSSIAITTPATKRTYNVGDVLDITGLVVTGTYSDTTTKTETITTSNITGFNSSAPIIGQVLTIIYGGKMTTYTINVIEKKITGFNFITPAATGVINESAKTILVSVPYNTNLIALIPSITIIGSSVSPASGVAQDFTNPVTYTVTAADGSTQAYTVTVVIKEEVRLTVSKGSGSPVASNIQVSDTNSTDDVLMNQFKIKATGSDINFNQLSVGLTGVVAGVKTLQDMLGELTLKRGSDVLATASTFAAADTGIVTFNLDDPLIIDDGTTETFDIYVDVKDIDNFSQGDSLKVDYSNVVAKDSIGNNVGTITGGANGTVQTFYSKGIVVNLISTSAVVNAGTPGVTSDLGTFNITFKATSFGEDMWIDKTAPSVTGGVNESDVDITGDGTAISTINSTSATAGTNGFLINDGDTQTFMVTTNISPVTSGLFKVKLADLLYALTDVNGNLHYTNLDGFETPSIYLNTVIVSPPIDICQNVTGTQTEGPCTDTLCLAPNTWNIGTQHCDTPEPVNGTWSAWTPATSECGTGTFTQTRECVGASNGGVCPADENGTLISKEVAKIACTPDQILGCTDSTATNYDADATKDDSSCTYPPTLCTDETANNVGQSLPCTYTMCQYNPDILASDPACVAPPEPVNGTWSAWTPATSECGTGTFTQTRSCSGSLYGGTCEGSLNGTIQTREVSRTACAPSHSGGSNDSVTPLPLIAPLAVVPLITQTAVEGCLPGYLFSSINGKACPVVTTVVEGCATGYLFSPINGKACPQAGGQVLGAGAYHFTLLLKLGSVGNEVTELQKYLNTHNYNVGTPDGKFGPKTKAAVIKLQIANGLKGDGSVGPMTRALLNK